METPAAPRDDARVDQTLHGYNDGHRLLASSVQVPRTTQRVMLAMSDRSGPGRPKGFESYLTGYPLPELRSYAVARTWHATEMPRPGCVWTHTLVVPTQTLARLSTLLVFDGLFRRPEGPEFDRDSYTSPVSLESVRVPRDRERVAVEGGGHAHVAEGVLAALYGPRPDLPVFVLANGSDEWEWLVLEVWAQQWGGLRSQFSFCTGSVSPRSVADRLLDLQVVPQGRSKEAARSDGVVLAPGGSVRSDERNDAMGPEWPGGAWLPAAAADLDRGEAASAFRRRLRHYAADAGSDRASFAPVASLVASGFHLGHEALLSAASFLAREYPSARVGSRLKKALLGPPDVDDPASRGGDHAEEELDRLEILLTLPTREAFDPEVLGVKERVRAAVASGETRRDLASRLLGQERNEWGEDAFSALIGEMSATEIGDVFAWDENLLADVLRRNPRLVEERAVWEAPASVQQFVLRTVAATVGPEDEVWSALVSAALDARSDLAAAPIRATLGWRAAGYALDWLSTSRRRRLPPDWTRLVLDEPDLLLEWVREREGVPILPTCALVGELQPADRRVLALDPAPLVVVAQRARSAMGKKGCTPGSERFEIYASALAVLLAIGLRSPEGERLVRVAFAPIHDLAREGRLGWKRWRLLSSLGRSPDYAVWDRPSSAEQLERAAVAAYIRRGWHSSRFAEAMPTTEALRRALHYASRLSKSGRRFAKEIKESTS